MTASRFFHAHEPRIPLFTIVITLDGIVFRIAAVAVVCARVTEIETINEIVDTTTEVNV